jgi:hypothetical protein
MNSFRTLTEIKKLMLEVFIDVFYIQTKGMIRWTTMKQDNGRSQYSKCCK